MKISINSAQGEWVMVIESTANAVIKQTKKLLDKNGRKKQGAFLIEGQRLVADAILSGAPISYLLIAQRSAATLPPCHAPRYTVSDQVFDTLKDTVHSQGVLAVVPLPQNTALSAEDITDKQYLLYLDHVTDPGNMGTILRTADAAGVEAVVLSKGCVDVYNPKVVRATMASLFHVPLFFDSENDMALDLLQMSGFRLMGASLDAAADCYTVDWRGRTVIIIGNEANGIREQVQKRCHTHVKIPMVGRAESLNAAVACGILCYERLRQNREG